MKIAILIPCYNAAGFLHKLFEGINAQTTAFDEIICYDDCSTDNTADIARQLGAKVITGKVNCGAAYARNRLIEATTCNWIHFHDADDLIHPEFVKVMSTHVENEQVQLLCNTRVYDLQDTEGRNWIISYSELKSSIDQVSYFLNNVGFASMGLYSKSALTQVSGFDQSLRGNEDPDLHIRLANAGFKIKCVDQFLVEKVEHPDSFSHQNWFRCMHDKLKCLQKYGILLPPKYFNILGEQAAILSNYFYRENDPALSLQARQLAYQMNVKRIKTSKFSSFISAMFGVTTYLWIYRRRMDIKKLTKKAF
ncbi:glycosyltransferase family 2 protein [Mucilaginibacter boryungensis]|uniref:Glycosyltransferase family 2 protein n=1 Tax=Mucilaginibacter boryungensis TaxID=768480 RepID=A0ABR9XG49_9SPHI|nr:glycosyltransferase family 2 protein [Mucilaginibacter boryungensis]MBE9665998.1 glycosyltransferase family 2 protein [Mucilaginibacter boryungensis]